MTDTINRQYRYESILDALTALTVLPTYVETAAKIHDRTRKVRIEHMHAGDKHKGVMIGWIVQRPDGEFRVLSTPGGKSRKLPRHIWRIDGIGVQMMPLYLCPALRKATS